MRLIIYAILAFVVYYLFKGIFGKLPQSPQPGHERSPESGKELKRDPVCGTYIPEDTPYRLNHQGQTHYFCSEKCLKEYQKKLSEKKAD